MSQQQNSRRNDPKKPDSWFSWPVIIVLFALGLWPLALVALFFHAFGEEQKGKTSSARGRAAGETRAAASVESAVARAEEKRKSRDTAGEETAAQRREEAKAFSVQPANSGGKGKKARKKDGKKEKKDVPGTVLKIVGISLLAVGILSGLEPVTGLIEGWSFYLEDLLTSLAFAAAGAILWGRGDYLARTFRRSQRYILAIGSAEAMSMAEIAKRVNRSPAKAARELQKLIDRGYLGEDAYIDHEKGWFLRFGAAVEEPKQAAAPPKETEEGYSRILRDIRRANDRIADEALSRKIDRLEQISGLIFREVEAHPEKRSRIRTFFDYYLPTTQKLLDAYAEFDQTGVEGENLRQAKERIEQSMDAIVEGFEHQLDQLYSADAMDVVSDIRVMETMLQRDTASAARDFGYDRADAGTKERESGQQVPLEL